MIETDMLVAKMDLLIKRLDERAHEKEAMHGIVKAMELHMTCEVYGESGHSRNDCPRIREDDTYINNGFRLQGGNNGWNNQSRQPSLIDLLLGKLK